MTRTLVFATLLLIAGCSSAPRLSLEQINTRRVYEGAKDDIMNAARTFVTREMFKLQSFEPETGRIAGYKSVTFPRSTDPKVVIMQASILPEAQGKWQVSALFRFSGTTDILTHEEESLLVECYTSFFGQIDQVAK
jgi:hypothetical protein